MVEQERWALQRVDLIKSRIQMTHNNPTPPPKLEEKLFKLDPNERNSKGETLLIALITYVNDDNDLIKKMNLVLRAGADVNYRESRNQRTPLIVACLMKRKTAVQMLINLSSTRLMLEDANGDTALMVAANSGDLMLCQLLLNRIVLVNGVGAVYRENKRGQTVMDIVTRGKHPHLLLLFSQERIQLTARTQMEMSALRDPPHVIRRVWLRYKATRMFSKSRLFAAEKP